jgi:hypothetical protein
LKATRRLGDMSESGQDPWGDMPRWSDGEAAPDPDVAPAAAVPAAAAASSGSATSSEPAEPTAGAARADHHPTTCPWCATPAADGATRCSSCGAALAQRESIGDLVVPGLTAVDPALKDLDGRPIHLRGPSPTQGAASGIIVAAAAGGPIGLAIIGGVGALAAAEYLGAGGEKGRGHEHVGETSEAVLQAIERLERGETLPVATDETPRPEPHPGAAAGAQSADPSATPGSVDKEAGDGGS